jgi:hypothetical protein
VFHSTVRLIRSTERGGEEDGEGHGGVPGEDGVPDAGGVGAARAVLDGLARTYSSLSLPSPRSSVCLDPLLRDHRYPP